MKYLLLTIVLFPFNILAASDDIERHRSEAEEYWSQLDGDWEGKISSYEIQNDYPNKPFESEIRIRIHGDNVLIGVKRDGEWFISSKDAKIIRHKTHAVIVELNSDKAWVEGFTYTITLGEADELNMLWSRAVSNYLLKPSNKEARGYFHGFSTLKRI